MQTSPTTPTPQDGETLKVLTKLVDAFNQKVVDGIKGFENTLVTLDRQFAENQAKLAGIMGQTQMALVGLREETAVALPGVIALGGELTDAFEIQKGVATSLKTNTVLLGDTVVGLYAAGRAVGVSSDNMGEVVGNFQDAGIQAGLIKDRLQETVDIARSIGVNTTAVFALVQENLSKLNKYGFSGGVEGLAKMAATSASMRVNMSEIFNFAERVFTPEGAIETVATLQRMGAAVGDLADPFRLSYLASEDVGELNNQLVQMTERFTYFDEKTKEFKVFPNAKRDLREIAQAVGVNFEEMVKMSFAQQKLNEITGDFRIRGISEEDKLFIANVSQYSKEKGGFTVKIGKDEKLISELSTSDLNVMKEASKGPQTVEDIAKAQLDEMKLLRKTQEQFIISLAGPTAASKMFTDVREVLRGGIEGIQAGVTSSFGNQRQAQTDINKFVSELGGSLTDILEGNLNVTKITGILEKTFEDLSVGVDQITTSFTKVPFKEIMEKYVSSGNVIYDGALKAANGFGMLTEKVGQLTKTIGELKKPDLTVVPKSTTIGEVKKPDLTVVSNSTKVEISDVKYTGEVSVKLETPAGTTQNIAITDQMAYDLFQNPTFQKMNQMALQNAMSQSQFAALPNRAMTTSSSA
jgi:hypothetical protein